MKKRTPEQQKLRKMSHKDLVNYAFWNGSEDTMNELLRRLEKKPEPPKKVIPYGLDGICEVSQPIQLRAVS